MQRSQFATDCDAVVRKAFLLLNLQGQQFRLSTGSTAQISEVFVAAVQETLPCHIYSKLFGAVFSDLASLSGNSAPHPAGHPTYIHTKHVLPSSTAYFPHSLSCALIRTEPRSNFLLDSVST